jgi:CRP-like cAMP-binding protein
MIADGTVFMLSSNEKTVLLELKRGDFFGEYSLYTTTKRSSSFIAGTFSIIYILEKEKFVDILKRYPRLQFEYRLYGKQLY